MLYLNLLAVTGLELDRFMHSQFHTSYCFTVFELRIPTLPFKEPCGHVAVLWLRIEIPILSIIASFQESSAPVTCNAIIHRPILHAWIDSTLGNSGFC